VGPSLGELAGDLYEYIPVIYFCFTLLFGVLGLVAAAFTVGGGN
jgi:hypothetical protein